MRTQEGRREKEEETGDRGRLKAAFREQQKAERERRAWTRANFWAEEVGMVVVEEEKRRRTRRRRLDGAGVRFRRAASPRGVGVLVPREWDWCRGRPRLES